AVHWARKVLTAKEGISLTTGLLAIERIFPDVVRTHLHNTHIPVDVKATLLVGNPDPDDVVLGAEDRVQSLLDVLTLQTARPERGLLPHARRGEGLFDGAVKLRHGD